MSYLSCAENLCKLTIHCVFIDENFKFLHAQVSSIESLERCLKAF